jgi:REP element-mobilizing transposase RayT
LLNFDKQRYEMQSFVIMPNHVHLLFAINPSWSLEQIVGSWKKFTARKINANRERRGALWQEDYWDRMVRNAGQQWRYGIYIKNNPLKAKLRAEEYYLWEKT